ncbi:aspartyl-phosphate phosphatase Spo0E family protein [Senegalia massiliensis]|uniref:aspartyl-phosphate phosphatase Spo0E family protein n=1 Tax=Senegalia massiliensis TaxID=1720316 RepID=UPI001031BFBF|nr:aspartyl-phosphate phosphatase Spo0E family protein [Senegalia massiliensis]
MVASFIDENKSLKEEIEVLRYRLHQAIMNDKSRDEILELSKRLDTLISLYYRKK